jgi:hypothetical protein
VKGEVDMEHKNIEVFFSFLEQNLTEPVDNRETWIHSLEKSAEVTGSSRFEIDGKETKSGLPETYYFRREHFIDDADWNYRIVHGEMDRNVKVTVDRNIAPAFWAKIDAASDDGDTIAEFLSTGGSSSCEVSVADVAMAYAKSLPEWEDGAVAVEGENFSIIAISVDYEYPSDEFWENVHADADAGNAVARLIPRLEDYWEYPAAIADKIREYAESVPGWIDGEEPLLFNEI